LRALLRDLQAAAIAAKAGVDRYWPELGSARPDASARRVPGGGLIRRPSRRADPRNPPRPAGLSAARPGPVRRHHRPGGLLHEYSRRAA